MTEDSPGLDHEVTCNMPYSFPPDVNELVCAHMSSGKYASEDELLRAALQALTEEEEDLAAVRESIGDWLAGDPGVPLESGPLGAIHVSQVPERGWGDEKSG
jgi:Arc/MetJ-type ribon-helix-helix transcriptional regulator